MPNRLAGETSPYLLQHQDNPVDWQPWGEEARGLAAEREVPLLVSIGYSACHWCHVMERESFTDAATAAYMNEHFVPVKVDREERPDVDAIYMEALQGMTGSGGWPLTAFCDPEGVPFHCGTYFPPEPRQGMPSFRQVLEAVVEAFSERRGEIGEAAAGTRQRLGAVGRLPPTAEQLGEGLLAPATERLLELADPVNGGFGSAPKFPPASALDLLLARGETDHVGLTLDAMAAGGIHDQLGGGFARYSVDAGWLVPHFEKMLYDNALLIGAYLHGWQELGEQRHIDVARGIADWALREMRGPEGGFYSALDADSEGVEGRFYTWTPAEARDALEEAGIEAPDAGAVLAYLGIEERGHLEGRSILHLGDSPAPDGIEEARGALFAARAERVRPDTDDKRLCAWNALFARALAELGAALGEARYLNAATECLDFLLEGMRDEQGRLLRTYNRGEARLAAYLEDHAYLLEALLATYQATFDPRWYEEAVRTAETMIEHFADPEHGGFFTTADDHEQLIVRRKDIDDHPAPSGNSSAASGLLRLAALGGEARYEELAVGVLELLGGAAGNQPQGLAYLLGAADFHARPTRQVALIAPAAGHQGAEPEGAEPEGTELEAIAPHAAAVRARYRPHLVLAGGVAGSTVPALLADRPTLDGGAAAYLCERFTCKAPVGGAGQLAALLDEPPR